MRYRSRRSLQHPNFDPCWRKLLSSPNSRWIVWRKGNANEFSFTLTRTAENSRLESAKLQIKQLSFADPQIRFHRFSTRCRYYTISGILLCKSQVSRSQPKSMYKVILHPTSLPSQVIPVICWNISEDLWWAYQGTPIIFPFAAVPFSRAAFMHRKMGLLGIKSAGPLINEFEPLLKGHQILSDRSLPFSLTERWYCPWLDHLLYTDSSNWFDHWLQIDHQSHQHSSFPKENKNQNQLPPNRGIQIMSRISTGSTYLMSANAKRLGSRSSCCVIW
jgi:hypothetical protein